MRSNNKRLILNFLYHSNPISKRAIAQELDISITSVSTFINELLQDNLIMACGNAQSTGGRKSGLFKFNPDAFFVIGADIQIDCLVTLVLNASGMIIAKNVTPLQQTDERYITGLLTESIINLCKQSQVPLTKLAGIGIGVPGIVNRQTGLIDFAPNLGWKNVNLPALLEVESPVLIENEANAGAIGETAFGLAQGIGNVIYVSIGAGIGTGLIFDHRLFEGKNYRAGEFGHMTVEPGGILCRCGNRGCWESYASTEAALRLYRQYSGQTIQSYQTFLNRFRENDPAALKVMDETLNYLALGVANLINGLNPEMIVIGGEITQIQEIIYPRLLKLITNRALAFSLQGTSIRFSDLNNHAAALGVGSLVIKQRLAAF